MPKICSDLVRRAAQNVDAGRIAPFGVQLAGRGVVRGDERGKDGDEDHKSQDDHAYLGGAVLQQPAQRFPQGGHPFKRFIVGKGKR